MIPIWTEDSDLVKGLRGCHCYALERCVFCGDKTNTWHENTNNPVCKDCASVKKVVDIPEDWGQNIRKQKRNGTFNRGDSVRAN